MTEEFDTESHDELKARKRRTHYTTEEWVKIVTMWEGGDYSIRSLAKEFGRDPGQLHSKLKKAGKVKGARKEEMEKMAMREMERDMGRNVGLRVQRANDTKNDTYEWATKVSQLGIQILAKAVTDKKSFGSVKPDLLALKVAMDVLKGGQDMRYVALGLDKGEIVDEAQLPEFGVFEMTAEEREQATDKADKLLRLSEDLTLTDLSETEKESQDSETEMKSNMERLRSKIADEESRVPGSDR